MKGPSLEAIRKFKQLQEEKKRLEDDKKVREKLTTLEHRAAQGDKKAKTQLKQIEKVEENRNKISDTRKNVNLRPANSKAVPTSSGLKSSKHGARTVTNRPKQASVNFDELMKLAASNNNEVRHEERKEKPKERRPIPRIPTSTTQATRERPAIEPISKPTTAFRKVPAPPVKQAIVRQQPSASRPEPRTAPMRRHIQEHVRSRSPIRRGYYDDDYDDDDDYYESDGFVVDEDDEEVQDELSKTIRNVFNYDKRRCDLRERELDREYRAIGRVNTFEDLEREERRASRLAAAEDAEALRDLEERKRLKKQRLKGLRD